MIELIQKLSTSVYGLIEPDFLISFFIKSSVVVITALFILQFFKKYTPSFKYRFLNLALFIILVLPFVPEIQKPVEVVLYEPELFATSMIETPRPSESLSIDTVSTQNTKEFNTRLTTTEIGLFVWLAGIVVLVFFLLREISWLQTFRYHAIKPGANINDLVDDLMNKISLERKVQLLFSSKINTPLTFGTLRPTIILPKEAEEWNDNKLSIVILHELIHIKRNDYLTNLITSLGVVLCWYNPFAWIALNKQKVECEKACDEAVLATGINPSTYATELLSLAEISQGAKVQFSTSISILGSSSMKQRIKSIIQNPKKRLALSRSLTMVLVLFVLFETYSLSAVKFYSEEKSIDNPIEFINSTDLTKRLEASRLLIDDRDPKNIYPILQRLEIEPDAEVRSNLIVAYAKFESSKNFYRVAKHINAENLDVKLQVLDYMKVISCFPSYLVVEASTASPNPAIAEAARSQLRNFDQQKLKKSIRNFAVNFKYNNELSTTIGNKMSWINGYQSIDQLTDILKSDDVERKRSLGEQLLAIAENGEFNQLKDIIQQHN